jgi:hypothetical protein
MQFVFDYPNHSRTFKEIGTDTGLWRLKHDFEFDVPPLRPSPDTQGAPETVRLITTGKQTIPFDRNLQLWYWKVLNPGLPQEAFAALHDTFFPGDGGEVGRNANYVTGERLGGDDPTFVLYLTFGGAIVRAVEVKWSGGHGVPINTPMLRLQTLNPYDPKGLPTNLPYTGNEWCVHHAVTVFGNKVNPYVYHGGRAFEPHKPCYHALFGVGGETFVKKEQAVKLESTILPGPYVPPWLECVNTK